MSLEKVLNFIKKHEEATVVKQTTTAPNSKQQANHLDLSGTEKEALQMLV
jgi:hypothetical protein